MEEIVGMNSESKEELELIHQGKARLLGIISVLIIIAVSKFSVVHYVTNYQNGITRSGISINFFPLIPLIFYYYLYRGSSKAKITLMVFSIIWIVITTFNIYGDIKEKQTVFLFNAFPSYLAFIVMNLMLLKSKSIKKFLEYQQAIKKDIEQKVELEENLYINYKGRVIATASTYIGIYYMFLLILKLAFIGVKLINIENQFLVYADMSLTVIFLICIYNVYRKNQFFTPLMVMIAIKILWIVGTWVIYPQWIYTDIGILIQLSIILYILIKNKREVISYMNSNIKNIF